MRTISLLPTICLALYALAPAAAVPIGTSVVVPVVTMTLDVVGETSLPNIVAPKPGGVPTRREYRSSARVHPRAYHSADFSAAPNATVPDAPAPAASKRTLSLNTRSLEPEVSAQAFNHKIARAEESSSLPTPKGSNVATEVATAIKEVETAREGVDKEVNKAVPETPSTPMTQPDTSAADAAAAEEAQKAAQAKAEEASQPSPSPGAYPDFASSPHARRHDLVIDMNRATPTGDESEKEKEKGLINLDSDHDATDAPASKNASEQVPKDAAKDAKDAPKDADKNAEAVPQDAAKEESVAKDAPAAPAA